MLLSLLGAAALATALITLLYGARSEVAEGSLDPAVEHYTHGHARGYADIDRWAFRGMSEPSLTGRLQQAGYGCERSRPQEVTCTRSERWPLQRTLTVRARFDTMGEPRLRAADAQSTLDGDGFVARQLARGLRGAGWMEPQTLAVRGFEIASIDLLSRMVADALRGGGWYTACSDTGSVLACAEQARTRRASGFAPVPPQPFRVGEVKDVVRALERLRLDAVPRRGPDHKPADALLVRVKDAEQWMDFIGSDLAGHELAVSVSLAVEGGAASKVVVRLDHETRELAVKGLPRTANVGVPMFLLPEAAAQQEYRFATWFELPNPQRPWSLEHIKKHLPEVDPAFQPRLVKHSLAALAAPEPADAALGLHPALLLVEHRGETLRAAGSRDWLPEPAGLQLVAQDYAQDAVTRAAWALALCDPALGTIGLDPACWQRVLVADGGVVDLLRHEVDALQALYAGLEPGHPLHRRLDHWRLVLALR
ncbi:hypothetical protein [Caldimonas brevitalea]|uniref:hypothetical protein n=1 Tax=Caldimonas brevitalea TaxID=413882 RepID=UPI0012F9FD3F|nr:hypothetical protein [Caldimonas brevitalea]